MKGSNIQYKLQELEKTVLRLDALVEKNADDLGCRFTIKDTEFLLRLLSGIQVNASDVDIFKQVNDKLKYLQQVLLEKGIEM
jgi:hypothetical protein